MYATTVWTTFVERCLEERVPVSRFHSLATLLYQKYRLASQDLTSALLKSQKGGVNDNDPLFVTYIGQLLQLKHINGIDLLANILRNLGSRHGIVDEATLETDGESIAFVLSPALEQSMLVMSTKLYAAQGYAGTRAEAVSLFEFLCKAMKALTSACSQGVPGDLSSWVSTIGNLFMVSTQHQTMSPILEKLLSSNTFSKSFIRAVLKFQPVLTRLAPQTSARIELYIQSQSRIKTLAAEYSKEEGASMSVTDLQSQVPDMPAAYCRASLLVHLHALLFRCPSVDQSALLAYLQARYKGNFEKAVQDLVLASFDLLILRTAQAETDDDIFLTRSFIINKLPIIILSCSSISLIPLDAAFNISQAMSRVSPAATNREDFLQSCALHGLMTEQNVEQVVGGRPPVQSHSKAQKVVLLQQYQAGSQQPEALVARLGDLDGNVGAYAEALVEILHNLCTQRHTMPLKSLCHAFLSSSMNLDIMVMLVGVERLLQPVCQIIDDWQHEDDHGEYQLSYDEFGACILLVVACAKRFDLSPEDVAALSAKSFVAEIMSNSVQAPRQEELTESQQGHLRDWIKALFEMEGISDELMSSCPPHEFYRIVGTLFRVSLHACRVGAISHEKLHSALELMLEPFLLPSILSAVSWLARNAWESSKDAQGLLTIMQELIKPDPDSASMRNTVLSAASADLLHILNSINDGGDIATKSTSLQQILTALSNYQRDTLSTQTEQISQMIGAQQPIGDIKAYINGLCAWSVGLTNVSPQYNHAYLLNAIRYSGPTRLLQEMVNAIMLQNQTGLGEQTLDLGVAMVCALHYSASPCTKGAKSLGVAIQQALQSELSRAPAIALYKPLRVQTLVRLSRRISAELAPAPALDLNLSMTDMGDGLPLDLPSLPEFSMEEVTQLAAPGMEMPPAQPVMQEPVLSFDGAADPFSLDIEAAIAAQQASGQEFSAIPGSADDDIFAGLTYDADMDFS